MAWGTAQDWQLQDELASAHQRLLECLGMPSILAEIVRTIRQQADPRWNLAANRQLLERADDLIEESENLTRIP
jgi:hypothetical protein